MAIKPLVHMNGTGGERLVADLQAACESLTEALTRIADAAPNARDYYPLGDDAWRAARDQHEADMTAIRDMRSRYMVAWEHVQEQIDSKEARRG